MPPYRRTSHGWRRPWFLGSAISRKDFLPVQIRSFAERNVSGLRVIHWMVASGNNLRREIADAQEQASAPASETR